MTILLPTLPIRFNIARLRLAVAEESRFSDEELVAFMNAGYLQACARAQALPTVATVTVPAGLNTGTFPSDWGTTIGVFYAGRELEAIPLEHSTRGYRLTYFQVGNTIGLGLPDADVDNDLTVLYARIPDLLGLDDFPEWGREWDWLLRQYAAWRCVLASGGAQTIRKAQALRLEFDTGVRDLRRQVTIGLGASAGAQVKRSILELKGAPIAG